MALESESLDGGCRGNEGNQCVLFGLGLETKLGDAVAAALETGELMWRCSLAEAIPLVLLGRGFGSLTLEPLYLLYVSVTACYGGPVTVFTDAKDKARWVLFLIFLKRILVLAL